MLADQEHYTVYTTVHILNIRSCSKVISLNVVNVVNPAESVKVQKSVSSNFGQSVRGPLTCAPVTAASLHNGLACYWVITEPGRDFVRLQTSPDNGLSLPISVEFGPFNSTHLDRHWVADCTGETFGETKLSVKVKQTQASPLLSAKRWLQGVSRVVLIARPVDNCLLKFA